jgi:23S rRNA (guanine2445-N2)-methyltransferase / 23S rRNA (guanine2069-N7)-methyltransferase
MFNLFISCPKGLEYLLEEEVKELGFLVSRVSPQGVYGETTLNIIYQIILWSRIANRVQLILFSGQAHNQQNLYSLCNHFPWQTIFSPDKTMSIEFHGTSDNIRNSMFGGQVIKDAIVDHFRQLQGIRPTIDKERPEILIHAHLKHDTLTVSLDLVGYSLHQRSYRLKAGPAPLKENVAAAILRRLNWSQLSAEGYDFFDPLCGSGTLVIEAAMIAAGIAPGLLRSDQALMHWVAHHPSLWEKMRVAALNQVKPLKNKFYGADADERVIKIAQENAERAGVTRLVNFQTAPLKEISAPSEKGYVVTNPPYGERLGETTQLVPLYQQLGSVLHSKFQGWRAAFLTTNPMLAKATGLRSEKKYTFFNGALECKLFTFDLLSNEFRGGQSGALSAGAQMFANRLSKNSDHLKKWAKNNHISCYRVYDADLPEYAYAIDIYGEYAVLQEYSAPTSIPAHKVEQRSLDIIQVTPNILSIPAENLIVKQRKRQKGLEQYQQLNQTQRRMVVEEGRAKFWVNLYDYLDTGLFLDHRLLRLRFAKLSSKTRFLNCFCYTGTASVHAALAGAQTTNVDLSKNYLQWAQDNFKLNNLALHNHEFIHADCTKWLKLTKNKFDVIFFDPPSFSNSKRMEGTLDIQRDHVMLIHAAMRLLAENGQLFFSTNLRQFKLSELLTDYYEIKNISQETIDRDFQRNTRIHQCYIISKQQ